MGKQGLSCRRSGPLIIPPPDGRHPERLFFVQIFDLVTKKGYSGPTNKPNNATTYSRLFLSRLCNWLIGYRLLVGPRLLIFVAKSKIWTKIRLRG